MATPEFPTMKLCVILALTLFECPPLYDEKMKKKILKNTYFNISFGKYNKYLPGQFISENVTNMKSYKYGFSFVRYGIV